MCAVLALIALALMALLAYALETGALVDGIAWLLLQLGVAILQVATVLLNAFGPTILIIAALAWLLRSVFRGK